MTAKKVIYLDYAAATPLDEKVEAAMEPYFSRQFYNPSATYTAARKVAKDIATARQRVAKWLGAKPGEIVLTAGGTEANNLAINGIMAANPKGNLVVSAIEHESVLKPAKNYPHKIVKVGREGVVDLSDLVRKIDNRTILVSIMYANNEIGTVEPIREIAKILQKIRSERAKKGNNIPLYLHTDACQAANYLDLHVSRLGVDLMTLNSGKIYGPKQSGVLYIRAGVNLEPQILGGGQERGLRSGTENVPAIIGLAAALELVQSNRKTNAAKTSQLQKLFFELVDQQLPNTVVNGPLKNRLPNNVHLTFPGIDNETLMIQLDEQGILCAVGSACSASSEEPSHVLKAIGLSDKDAQSSLRFTLGCGTTEAEIKRTVKVLKTLV